MTDRPKILVTQKVPDPVYPLLEAIGDVERNEEEGVIWSYDELLRRGPGHDYVFSLLTDASHATLGLIGIGRIGRLVARRAIGFEMKVLYYNVNRMSEEEEGLYHATYMPLEDLLEQSDFVSVHVPYNFLTYHLIGERELRMMKPTAFLINTARGPIVDEKALVKMLQERVIAGAGLDVYENEPAVEPELLQMENVVLLPHIASASLLTRTRMATMACDNIVAHHYGQYPPNILNPEAMK